ncbi:MAG: hypothetical protein D6793_08520 [Thermoflexia bacterium]|nr:MAG: hypothetical protein D6793_08520 [Thermoflexia bacterium]
MRPAAFSSPLSPRPIRERFAKGGGMNGTVGELFELTLRAEREALRFYEELERRFAHVPQVARFWQEMAEDERDHIRLVERARSGLTPEQLAEPADPVMLHEA